MRVLQRASVYLEEKGILTYLVGGTQEEFERATQRPSSPLYFGGSVAHNDVANWCAAADALLVLGTRANEFSYFYTAPMKLFEYLASGRPVVAADTPALRSLVLDDEVTFYTPDGAPDLAQKISNVLAHAETAEQKSMRGIVTAREHLWSRRAERIGVFIGL